MGDQKYMTNSTCFEVADIYKRGSNSKELSYYGEIVDNGTVFVYDCPLQLYKGLTLSMYLYLKDEGKTTRRKFVQAEFMEPEFRLEFDVETIFQTGKYETSKLIVTKDGEPLFEGNIAYTLNNFGYLALVFERDENDADAEFKVTLYTLTGATLATFPVPQVKQLPELKKLTVGNLAIGDRISVLQLHKRPFNHEDIGELVCSTVKDRACVVSDFKEVGWIAKNYPVPDSLVAYYPLWEHTNTWYNKDPWEIQRDLKLNGHTLVDVGWKNDSSRPMFISSLPDNDKMAEITVPAANEFVLAFFFNHPVGPDSFSSVLFDMEGFGQLRYEYTPHSENGNVAVKFSINIAVSPESTFEMVVVNVYDVFFPTSYIFVSKSLKMKRACIGIENPFNAKINSSDPYYSKYLNKRCESSLEFSEIQEKKPIKLILNPTTGSTMFALKYHNTYLFRDEYQKVRDYDNGIVPPGEGYPTGVIRLPSMRQEIEMGYSGSKSLQTGCNMLITILSCLLAVTSQKVNF